MSVRFINIQETAGCSFDPAQPGFFHFKQYKKKPIVVNAVQLDKPIEIDTLEGTMRGDVGDFLIRGVKGEYYPCKPDIFHATYEEVPDEK